MDTVDIFSRLLKHSSVAIFLQDIVMMLELPALTSTVVDKPPSRVFHYCNWACPCLSASLKSWGVMPSRLASPTVVADLYRAQRV